ncbi:DUF455 family protein [Massilia atriviolacea]|uniref:DUF455 family protein n=1 Tax=Massilia atriviolacea TaxID=2495579 RepID=A0A430HMT6_9BURK|nr:DUF455 family protein [Massilia atriviolacea]RSZ58868.1 DUF455 family protein [Massilia atriviolacea]
MLGMSEITQFYADVDGCLSACLVRHCQQLVGASAIDDKIEIGLALGALLALSGALDARVQQIASAEVWAGARTPPAGVHAPDALAHTARILRQACASSVLYDPELALMDMAAEVLPGLQRRYALGDAPGFPRQPARDARLHWSADKPFRFSEGRSIIDEAPNYRGFLFYVLIDVEISAMEICAYMILNNRAMPPAFFTDMARQIWDEARHAAYIRSTYQALGGVIGAHPYTNTVLDRFLAADDLLDGLIVQQLLQEANAVETNLTLAAALNAAGRHEEANSFLIINNDEALHARMGNRWVRYLAQAGDLSNDFVFSRMIHMSKKVSLPVFGTGGWTDTIRTEIGFPDWFMDKKKWLLGLTERH